MNRRDAISRVTMLLGISVLGADVFLSGCTKKKEESIDYASFSEDIVCLLDEIGEIILPETSSSAGAKAAKVGEFMKTVVLSCYEKSDQELFLNGIGELNKASSIRFHKTFMEVRVNERCRLIEDINKEATRYASNKKENDPLHYFSMIKQLTLLGYFTSEIGATQALRYVPVPGRFEGCIAYRQGEKAWSDI